MNALVDVLRAAWRGVAANRPVLGVRQRLLLAQPAHVHLAAAALIVADGAPDEAALSYARTHAHTHAEHARMQTSTHAAGTTKSQRVSNGHVHVLRASWGIDGGRQSARGNTAGHTFAQVATRSDVERGRTCEYQNDA